NNFYFYFFFSSRRRHTRFDCDWSSDVCSSDLQHWGVNQYLRLVRAISCVKVRRFMVVVIHRNNDPEKPADFRHTRLSQKIIPRRSEERRVGKECKSTWSTYH